ncbi:MAG: secretin N-terminal domain-containing protein [Candidatus Omnitrophota bacterium]
MKAMITQISTDEKIQDDHRCCKERIRDHLFLLICANLRKMQSLFILQCIVLCFTGFALAQEDDTQQADTQQTDTQQESAPAEDIQLAQAMAAIDQSAQAIPKIVPLSEGIAGRISLDLRSIDIVEALKFLSLKAGLNIVTTNAVAGRVTLTVDDVAIQDIFDIMLRSNSLAYMKQGNIYNVMTEQEYKALFGKTFADIRQVKTIRIKYAIPDQVFVLLDTLKSDIGRVLVEPDSGTALIMDTPAAIAEVEKALEVMEQKTTMRVFTLQYANVKDIEEQLKLQVESKKVGLVKADERSNQIVVQALPERMPDIEALIKALDTKTKEVLIDTRIIKIRLTDTKNQGLEWEGLFNIGARAGMSYFGSTPFSVVQSVDDAWMSRGEFLDGMYPGGSQSIGAYPSSGYSTNYSSSNKVVAGEAMHIGMIDRKRDFDLLLKYLQTLGKTQILSNPQLAVVNNQEARIHVGEKQAYVTTTTTTGQSTTTISEEVTFVDIGIQLAVTPKINDDGYITMKIKPEISSVTSYLETPTGNKIPIIDTSMAETTLMIKDGATIILGGMRKEEKTDTTDQVPVLGQIPILGLLFSSSSKGTSRTELLIMITPHIVMGDKLVTADKREFESTSGKEYIDYSKLPAETGSALQQEPQIEGIKAYKEYTTIIEGHDALQTK